MRSDAVDYDDQTYVGKWYTGGGSGEYVVMRDIGGVFRFVVYDYVTVLSTTVPTFNVWYYIVCWHDSVNNQIAIQVNNGTPNTLPYSDGIPIHPSERERYPFVIGDDTDVEPLDGVVDEVGFWKRVLTPAERTALYNGGNGFAYPFYSNAFLVGLVSYWRMEEATGAIARDSHGDNDMAPQTEPIASVPGKIGNARDLYTGQGFQLVPAASNPTVVLGPDDAFTFSFWTRLNWLPALGGRSVFIGKGHFNGVFGGTGHEYAVMIYTQNGPPVIYPGVWSLIFNDRILTISTPIVTDRW